MRLEIKASIWISTVSLLILSGCADYMNRRDSVTLGAGNAPQANLAMQTVYPFPSAAYDTNIELSDVKSKQAYERYVEPCDPDVVVCNENSDELVTNSE